MHREALVEGAVDYHSLMFGEGTEDDARGVVEAEVAVPEKKNGSWAALVMSTAKTVETKPSTSKPSMSKKREEKKGEAKGEVKSDVKAEVKAEKMETNRSRDLPKEKKSEGNSEEPFKEVKDNKKVEHRRNREAHNGGNKVSVFLILKYASRENDESLISGSFAMILYSIRTV